MTLTPAYGRDYVSAKAAKEAFLSGKDWILNDISSPWDGKPCNIDDMPSGTKVNLRYAKLRKITTVKKP